MLDQHGLSGSRRHRLRFRVRSLLALVLFSGGVLGGSASLFRRAEVQRRIVASIEQKGGEVLYDRTWDVLHARTWSENGQMFRRPWWPRMKVPLSLMLCCMLGLSSLANGQGEMTVARFTQIEAKQGDITPLIVQLARVPIWKKAATSISMKYQDGRSFKEECTVTTKTVEGRYIVYTVESELYGQSVISILEFDEKAQFYKQWGLFGDTLTHSTIVYDFEKGILASTASYQPGFVEISVQTFSNEEKSAHTLIYRDGVLFLTRDSKTRPIGRPGVTTTPNSVSPSRR
jgi:hypothetical protein